MSAYLIVASSSVSKPWAGASMASAQRRNVPISSGASPSCSLITMPGRGNANSDTNSQRPRWMNTSMSWSQMRSTSGTICRTRPGETRATSSRPSYCSACQETWIRAIGCGDGRAVLTVKSDLLRKVEQDNGAANRSRRPGARSCGLASADSEAPPPPSTSPWPGSPGCTPTRPRPITPLWSRPPTGAWCPSSAAFEPAAPEKGALPGVGRRQERLWFACNPEHFRRPAASPVGRVRFHVAAAHSGIGPRLDEVVDGEPGTAQGPDPAAVGQLVGSCAVFLGDGAQTEIVVLEACYYLSGVVVVAGGEPRAGDAEHQAAEAAQDARGFGDRQVRGRPAQPAVIAEHHVKAAGRERNLLSRPLHQRVAGCSHRLPGCGELGLGQVEPHHRRALGGQRPRPLARAAAKLKDPFAGDVAQRAECGVGNGEHATAVARHRSAHPGH